MRRARTVSETGRGVTGMRDEARERVEATMNGTRGRKRGGRRGALQLLVVLAVVAVSAGPGGAVHDLNLLKLDGTATGTPVDWNDINPPVGGGAIPPLSQSGATARVFVPQCVTQAATTCVPAGTNVKTVEDPNGDGTYFAVSAKDADELNALQWGGTGAPDKDEITNAYAASFTNPTTVGPNVAGDTIVYFGMDRFAANGDANVAFWFFVGPVGLTGTTSGTFSGQHTAGVVAANGTVTTTGGVQVLSE